MHWSIVEDTFRRVALRENSATQENPANFDRLTWDLELAQAQSSACASAIPKSRGDDRQFGFSADSISAKHWYIKHGFGLMQQFIQLKDFAEDLSKDVSPSKWSPTDDVFRYHRSVEVELPVALTTQRLSASFQIRFASQNESGASGTPWPAKLRDTTNFFDQNSLHLVVSRPVDDDYNSKDLREIVCDDNQVYEIYLEIIIDNRDGVLNAAFEAVNLTLPVSGPPNAEADHQGTISVALNRLDFAKETQSADIFEDRNFCDQRSLLSGQGIGSLKTYDFLDGLGASQRERCFKDLTRVQRDILQSYLANAPYGMVMIAGAHGSGKSSLGHRVIWTQLLRHMKVLVMTPIGSNVLSSAEAMQQYGLDSNYLLVHISSKDIDLYTSQTFTNNDIEDLKRRGELHRTSLAHAVLQLSFVLPTEKQSILDRQATFADLGKCLQKPPELRNLKDEANFQRLIGPALRTMLELADAIFCQCVHAASDLIKPHVRDCDIAAVDDAGLASRGTHRMEDSKPLIMIGDGQANPRIIYEVTNANRALEAFKIPLKESLFK